MTGGERIVLGDEGEGDSDDSDPVLVTGEASVGGSAAVSAGPSSFSHSTVAPGSSGAPPAAPQAGGGRIMKPRSDTVRGVFRELAGKDLATTTPTREDILEALALMKRDVEEGRMSYAKNVPKFEAWLAKTGQAGVAKAFGYDHLPPPLPAHLANVVPPGSMVRAGAPAVNNPITQFTSLFKTSNQQRADEKNRSTMLASAQGRGFAELVTHVNAAHASPSGTYDGMTSLQYLNQHNVAAAPARGGATSALDQEIQRCLPTILTAPPGEQVQRAQSFKKFITAKKNAGELSEESFASYMGQFNTICAEMSRNPAVAAPHGGVDQATQHAIHMTQAAQYVAGRGAPAGGSADGDAAAAAAVLQQQIEAQLRAMPHGTHPLSAQQLDLQGIANAFMQQTMHAQNQQPIPPGVQVPVQDPPPAEPASGAAAATAQPSAPSPTPSGAATQSDFDLYARLDDVRAHAVFKTLRPEPGTRDIADVLNSTSGDVSATLKTFIVRAELASVDVADAVAFASAAPVKSLSVDEVTAVFLKLKDTLATEDNFRARNKVKRKTSDRITDRDVNALVAGAWPEAAPDFTERFLRREAAAEALRCESSKNATRLARAFNEIPVVDGKNRDYRPTYLADVVIDSALREKAPSDHDLMVSLGALVSAHIASASGDGG